MISKSARRAPIQLPGATLCLKKSTGSNPSQRSWRPPFPAPLPDTTAMSFSAQTKALLRCRTPASGLPRDDDHEDDGHVMSRKGLERPLA